MSAESVTAPAPTVGAAEAPGAGKPRTIVLALDGSAHSTYALHWVLENLLRPGDRLVLFSAYEAVFRGHRGSDGGFADDLEREHKAEAMKMLEGIKAELHAQGIEAAVVAHMGDPREAILRTCEEAKADHLVVGSKGKGAIKRALMGSVSTFVVTHAHCAVTVVRTPEGWNPPVKAH
ncbi:hypothetical protein DFJ74DRAFT_679626 [Hyaloraphidium curvatum]|nr:hypothetical protein DFJ74DRAFT_679626 [Hyaloraphidium curvatum]